MLVVVSALMLIIRDGGWMNRECGNSDGYCQENSGRPSAKTRSNRREDNSFTIACTQGNLLCELPLVEKRGKATLLTRRRQCSFLVHVKAL